MGLITALACNPQDLELLKIIVLRLESPGMLSVEDRRVISAQLRIFNEKLVPITYNTEDI